MNCEPGHSHWSAVRSVTNWKLRHERLYQLLRPVKVWTSRFPCNIQLLPCQDLPAASRLAQKRVGNVQYTCVRWTRTHLCCYINVKKTVVYTSLSSICHVPQCSLLSLLEELTQKTSKVMTNIETVSGPCNTCFWYARAPAVRNTSRGGAEWRISYRRRDSV